MILVVANNSIAGAWQFSPKAHYFATIIVH